MNPTEKNIYDKSKIYENNFNQSGITLSVLNDTFFQDFQ